VSDAQWALVEPVVTKWRADRAAARIGLAVRSTSGRIVTAARTCRELNARTGSYWLKYHHYGMNVRVVVQRSAS
jgi:hypothetical protein